LRKSEEGILDNEDPPSPVVASMTKLKESLTYVVNQENNNLLHKSLNGLDPLILAQGYVVMDSPKGSRERDEQLQLLKQIKMHSMPRS